MIDWGAILAEHGSAVWRTVYRLLDHHDDALDCWVQYDATNDVLYLMNKESDLYKLARR